MAEANSNPELSISEQSRQLNEQARALSDQARALGEKGRALGDQARQQAAEELARQSKTLAESIPSGGSSADRELQDQTRQLTERINKRVADALKRANRDATSATVEVDGRSGARSHRSGDVPEIVVPVVFIVFLFGFLMVKTIVNGINRRGAVPRLPGGNSVPAAGFSAEEFALLEKVQRTLTLMESRVEALETILADPRRTASFTTAAPRPAPITHPSPSVSHESKL